MKISVIFTTYNAPDWLEKVFWGFLDQSFTDFEIIVADDGSSQATAELVKRYRSQFAAIGVPLRHVWHEDKGFRKCRILNKAIILAEHDYIVFTDGDCIVREDFLAVHHAKAEPGCYLSGSYYKLPLPLSQSIGREDVESGRCFDYQWLVKHGLSKSSKRIKLTRSSVLAALMNKITPTRCNLKGSNASAWKKDLVAVGGFDERMAWGGLDRELGVRLINAGIKPKHVRYDAICVHLDHPRGYKDPEMVSANKSLRLEVQKTRVTSTQFGIGQLGSPPHQAYDFINWVDT